MAITQNNYCTDGYQWLWEDAFYEHGFQSGKSQIETSIVENVLIDAGYIVETDQFGTNNIVIISIKKDQRELIPIGYAGLNFGEDDPRDYLPGEILQLPDKELPEKGK